MTEVARTSDAGAHVHPPIQGRPCPRTATCPPTLFRLLPTPSAFVWFLPRHPQRPAAPAPICCLCPSRRVSALFSATSWGREKGTPRLEVLLGEGVPWSLRQMGEAPVGRTWMNFWEETVYHPLSLAAIQCFLPPVSLLILLIYLKELRKRRGLRWGAPHGGSDPRPPRLPSRGAIQRGPNLIFLQIVCQKQQGR